MNRGLSELITWCECTCGRMLNVFFNVLRKCERVNRESNEARNGSK